MTSSVIAGTIIGKEFFGLKAEVANNHAGFLIFHGEDADYAIESEQGFCRLIEIQGELEHLVDTQITAVGENLFYDEEWISEVVFTTDQGEVRLIFASSQASAAADLTVKVIQ